MNIINLIKSFLSDKEVRKTQRWFRKDRVEQKQKEGWGLVKPNDIMLKMYGSELILMEKIK